MKKSNLTFRLVILFISVFSLSSCQSVMKETIVAKLKADAAAITTPKEMGSGIRIDSVSADGLSMRFSYTMTNQSKGDLDQAAFYKTVKEEMLNKANTSPDFEFYKKNKVKLAFAYYFKNGAPLSTIIIKPEDYTDNKN
jgi:hypothetical protein